MAEKRKIYAIAHRVLTVKGVRDAIKHGANAIEIDFMPFKKGWWADHDGGLFSAGAKAADILRAVVDLDVDKQITFVWFDIKKPDWFTDPKAAGCVDRLRQLARDILQPAGIYCLYGFYGAELKRAWKVLSGDLNKYEAVCLNGTCSDVLNQYRLNGSDIPIQKRMMDNGLFNIPLKMNSILKELSLGCEAQREGKLGKVFTWTADRNTELKMKFLMPTGISGLIYGFAAAHYYDHMYTRKAADIIIDWAHDNDCDMASRDDFLW